MSDRPNERGRRNSRCKGGCPLSTAQRSNAVRVRCVRRRRVFCRLPRYDIVQRGRRRRSQRDNIVILT